MTIHIPDTIEGVMGLLKARKWEKAAIVWAYVHVQPAAGQPAKSILKTENKPYTPETFAALGIAGLRSSVTVQAYWENWQAAIDAGETQFDPDKPPTTVGPVRPGDDLIEPNMKWPPTDRDPRTGAERHIPKGQVEVTPERAAAAIQSDPKIATAAREALAENDRRESAAIRDQFYRNKGQAPPEVNPDYAGVDEHVGGGVLGEAMTGLDVAIEQMERKEWIDSLMRTTTALLQNISTGIAKFQYSTDPDEIERVQAIQSNLTEAAFKFSEGFVPLQTGGQP